MGWKLRTPLREGIRLTYEDLLIALEQIILLRSGHFVSGKEGIKIGIDSKIESGGLTDLYGLFSLSGFSGLFGFFPVKYQDTYKVEERNYWCW